MMKFWTVLCLALVSQVYSHGNMIQPPVWMDRGHPIGCGTLDLPTPNEFSDRHDGKPPDCLNFWYSNNVRIPGKETLPHDMSQPEVTCIHQAGFHDDKHEFPWHAPGTAPVFGPCGSLGGNPDGCNGDGKGKFGDCCSKNCDSFALGDMATSYAWQGAPITEWKAGSLQEVEWYVGANHAGGYSYRLCPLPEGGIQHLTEECFQEMPLDFVGDDQWVIYENQEHQGHRQKVTAKRTTSGTHPPGSQWTANPLLPHMEEGGSDHKGHGHVIDYVEVPNDLEPGKYVLSFRWDSKCSPQVWAVCSNIMIV